MTLEGSHGMVRSALQVRAEKPYSIPRFRVALIREGQARSTVPAVSSSADASRFLLQFFRGLDREHFLVCGLDAKHAIIGVNIVSVGSLTLAIVHPREVLKPLILMNAAAYLCAHNHPSGDATPSPEDRALTKRLKEAGELLGITLLDHLVFGHEHFYSFADHGWPGV